MNEDQQNDSLAEMLKRNLPALMKKKGEWLLMYQQGDQYVVQRVESEEHGKAILAEIPLPNASVDLTGDHCGSNSPKDVTAG